MIDYNDLLELFLWYARQERAQKRSLFVRNDGSGRLEEKEHIRYEFEDIGQLYTFLRSERAKDET